MKPWVTSIYLVQVYPASINYGVLVLFIEVILFVYSVNSVKKFGYSGCNNWQGFTTWPPKTSESDKGFFILGTLYKG